MNMLKKKMVKIFNITKTFVVSLKYFQFREFFKYFSEWRNSLNKERNSLVDAMPWISFTVINLLDKYLKPEMKVFEYGSGGSTLYFAKRVAKVVSIEHNKNWFEKMNLYLQELKLQNIDYKLLEPETDLEFSKKNNSDPDDYISGDANSFGKNYENYVKSIDKYPDTFFDVVSVDGRSRPSCCKHALPKIKVGGYLVYDNVEVSYYEDSIALLKPSEWSVTRYYGLFPYIKHFSMTLLAKKIK